MKYKFFIMKLLERDGAEKTADDLSRIMVKTDELIKMQSETILKMKNLTTFDPNDRTYIMDCIREIEAKSSEVMQDMINASVGDGK